MTASPAKRQAAQDKMEKLHTDLQRGVRSLMNSADWTKWLDTAAKFHRYSFNNTMLIMVQCPTATYVNSYNRWTALDRQVRKGEKGISILAPMTRKETDPATGTERSRLFGFRAVAVFDISQTDGAPLAEEPRPVLLDGEAPAGLWDSLAGIVLDRGYTLERGDCGTANGYTSPSTKTIRVREDVAPAQAVKTLAHEVAHMLLHTDDDKLTSEACSHRGLAEVEAESVAYLVSKRHGLATESYTLPYVAGWAGKDGEDAIRKTGERVIKTARLITDLTLAEVGEPAEVAA